MQREVEESTIILLNKEDVEGSTVDIHGKVPVVMKRKVMKDVNIDLRGINAAIMMGVDKALREREKQKETGQERHVQARKKPRGHHF